MPHPFTVFNCLGLALDDRYSEYMRLVELKKDAIRNWKKKHVIEQQRAGRLMGTVCRLLVANNHV